MIISLVGGAAMRTQEFLTNATIAALDTKRDATKYLKSTEDQIGWTVIVIRISSTGVWVLVGV